ncbi:GFA family protein [Sneathiella litorea]|uniref:GFA family protein n=1 Tax=Sneathiella litorea TaxID=2606216 RepID=A0A6L8W8L9_9PROT|nr:GFA family protein [Sneathiella litorea]MZR31009.1 GFA family protein [Sneathiella litorea]
MDKGTNKQGGCLCGAVRYEVHGPLRDIISCHCGQCQKSSGHYFAATAASLSNFRLTEERGLKWYTSSNRAERGFCIECGSNLFWRRTGGTHISILAGTLEGKTGLRTVRHIFVADKKDYYDITDGLPQYDSYPEELKNG